MPRSRMLKPEFWDDEKLAQISFLARLTYMGMWSFSDDYGSVKGSSLWLKNKIFPYDDIKMKDFENALQELQNLKRTIPYKHNEELYYYLPNFLKHQVINRPSKTRNPEPPFKINEDSENNIPEEKDSAKEEIRDSIKKSLKSDKKNIRN